MSQPRQQDKGGTLVEFAVSLVIILTVLFGIIDVGRAAYAYDWVSNAARQGTRFMAVRGDGCSQNPNPLPGGCPATKTDALNYVINASGNGINTSGIDTSQVHVTTLCEVTGSIASLPPCASRVWVQVRVSYNFTFITPFLRALPAWSMQSTSKVVVQN